MNFTLARNSSIELVIPLMLTDEISGIISDAAENAFERLCIFYYVLLLLSFYEPEDDPNIKL